MIMPERAENKGPAQGDYGDLAEGVERVHGEVQPLAPGGELLLRGEEACHRVHVHPRHRHPHTAVVSVMPRPNKYPHVECSLIVSIFPVPGCSHFP